MAQNQNRTGRNMKKFMFNLPKIFKENMHPVHKTNITDICNPHNLI